MSSDRGHAEYTDYDDFAEAYAAETENSLENAYYTRPAILDLAGDVTGRRILDIGCGAGPLMESLLARGATVTGVEPSIGMLNLARKRLGDDADLHQGALGGDPLPFPDATFDDAVACLVLHYLEDWAGPLAEIRRVLKPGGRLLVAVNHPFMYKLIHADGNYFATERYDEEYTFAGRTTDLTFWHRPLHTLMSEFLTAGFRITVVSEPPFLPEARDLFDLTAFPAGRFLGFLFLVLERPADA